MAEQDNKTDDLEELIDEEERAHPGFRVLVDEALQLRQLVRQLTEKRIKMGLSQRDVAERSGLKQSAIARLESFDVEPRFSTLSRYAIALGLRIDFKLSAA